MTTVTKSSKAIQSISVFMVDTDPFQPRKDFLEDAILELAQSIQRNGLLQPITIKAAPGGRYTIIAGERRFRAVQSLGWETIECLVYDGDNAKELQLVENINRADLTPMEIAMAYQGYLSDGHTLDELAAVVGKPKQTLALYLNVTTALPEIQHMVHRGQMSVVMGASLARLSHNGQLRALRVMNGNQLSVSECFKVSDTIHAEESQIKMMTEAEVPVLSPQEVKARRQVESAMARVCQALQEVLHMEEQTPGITAQAIAERLDITRENISLLSALLSRIKARLDVQRVKVLC